MAIISEWNIEVNGDIVQAGDIIDVLSEAEENRLIDRGVAVRVSDPYDNNVEDDHVADEYIDTDVDDHLDKDTTESEATLEPIDQKATRKQK
ncbi:hypothetical protein E0485_21775 [Paenibacillus albiflavus]|uniref:Uncharacterized protein n=1 Tax=Paenibacillus albiflavus TaxID=2545760 RepID=A0A4R4E4W4_9BACL|nr:hypothetical protein [Paenibacillus albiflavus]TCZ73051.1 hypothetical protein E0485_21775 [Paenibacillus albiflavus]